MSHERQGPIAPFDAMRLARASLLDHLPKEAILTCYETASGKEVSSGKFGNPESSAALAANAFGVFLHDPHLLSLPHNLTNGAVASSVLLEAEMRFPWSGGLHPYLDVAIDTPHQLIGIESKRYEPFRDRKKVAFSRAYSQPVWGNSMQTFERMRDTLASGQLAFSNLDAAQLVKHAFGLRTQASKRGKRALLLYLYAEPTSYPDGRPVSRDLIAQHRREVEMFTESVNDAASAVIFGAIRYAELLEVWALNRDERIRAHSKAMLARFDV